MSNSIGADHTPSSGEPEETKQAQSQDHKPAEQNLSVSELMSLKPIPKQHSHGLDGLGATIEFDGPRTTDISRLLSEKIVRRDLSNTKTQTGTVDFTWSATRSLDASANIGLTIPLGLRQHFRLQGVDVKALENQKQLEELKQRLNHLQNAGPLNDESILTEPKRRELNEAQESVRRASTLIELVSNTLYLARLLIELSYIEDARKTIGIAVSADPKNHLANQLFQELERVHPQDIAFVPVTSSTPQLSKSALAKRIINLSAGNVVVVGDLLIDELLEGKPTRISREAPVLILEHADTEHIPGGAANTAHNITALGAKCHAIGVCGQDDYSDKLARMLEKHNISHELIHDPLRPTTVKTRILSKSHSLMQQLLRLDRISHEAISASIANQLADRIEKSAGSFDAIILSDYKAGAIVDGVVDACRKVAAEKKIMLIVDAQNDFHRFSGCTLITPNQPDSEQAVGFKIDSQQSLEKAGLELLSQTKAEAVLLTRGSAGMALFQKHHGLIELPPFNKSEVFDVTGAGDTVVATMTLALVTGASFVEAMALGNLAAGIVVKKVGTAVTSQREMLETLDSINFFK